jgi:DNA-directed RNA polymerase subunit M/transcription elongation factor TFIIS
MSKSIIDKDGKMICPRCEKHQDILYYKALKMYGDYNCAAIYKCANCRAVFAPLPDLFDVVSNQ